MTELEQQIAGIKELDGQMAIMELESLIREYKQGDCTTDNLIAHSQVTLDAYYRKHPINYGFEEQVKHLLG